MPNSTSDEVAVRGGGDGQDIVEAHRDVGEDDDPDRLPQGGPTAHRVLRRGAGTHQLDGDPEQQEAARELDQRNRQQGADEGDPGQPQDDRRRRAPMRAWS